MTIVFSAREIYAVKDR